MIVLVLTLTYGSLFLSGTNRNIGFCLIPSFGSITRGKVNGIIFTTVSRTFFALDLNVNTVRVFNDCLSEGGHLANRTMDVILLSAFITLVTKFVVVPTYFSFNIRPSSNPSLLFVALPGLFGGVPNNEV